jgi:hypothetical protein
LAVELDGGIVGVEEGPEGIYVGFLVGIGNVGSAVGVIIGEMLGLLFEPEPPGFVRT